MTEDTTTDLPLLVATEKTSPPNWAVLQRRLIDAIDEAAPIFLDKYPRPGGALVWREDYPGDGVWADDLYEAFFNWPQYHALGGSDYCGEKSLVQWNAITRQLAVDYGRVTDEFVNDDDWFHNAENYVYFYALGMVDPTVRDNVARARRFAGFYVDDEASGGRGCYDPAARAIRSPFSGSRGPLFHARFDDVRYNLEHEHTVLSPRYDEPEGEWWKDAAQRQLIHERFDEVVMHSDVVVNLGTVPLVACAYLYTGDEKYRRWIVDYVGAWIERTRANGGIIPDNVGPNGEVGERRNGQWWGGFYGWTGRMGHNMMGRSLAIAAEAALLVTGDDGCLDLPRMWLDLLIEKGQVVDGRLLVPKNHTTADGWTNHTVVNQIIPVHLWNASMADGDWEQLERFRVGAEEEWQTVTSRGPRSLDDRPWTRWLAGELPDYPEQILRANYQEVCRRLEEVMADEQDLTRLDVHHWQKVNPVLTEALAQLTTGGPQTVYWGGLAVGRLRYWDAEGRRAGLPRDVAALVHRLDAGSASATLVNLSVRHSRELIIGAGNFGEHEFTTASCDGAEATPVDGPWLRLRLPPGSQVELELGMRRFVRQPSYAFPWHPGDIPVR